MPPRGAPEHIPADPSVLRPCCAPRSGRFSTPPQRAKSLPSTSPPPPAQEVHRQLRARQRDAAPRDGDGDGDGVARQCGLPEDFYESNEAHSLGLWLLGGETTVADRQLLVEEPDSTALDALLLARAKAARGGAGFYHD